MQEAVRPFVSEQETLENDLKSIQRRHQDVKAREVYILARLLPFCEIKCV